MIKIECIICDKEILNPNVDQLCCDKSSCNKSFSKLQNELWRFENSNKVRMGELR